MTPHSGNHPKQLGSGAQNLVFVPVTPSYSDDVQKTPLKMGFINCQSVCNKCGEIVDVVGEVGFGAVVVTETWRTGGISDQKTVGDVTPAGYSFHRAAHTHRKGGGVGILIQDSLQFEKHSHFQASSFEIIN